MLLLSLHQTTQIKDHRCQGSEIHLHPMLEYDTICIFSSSYLHCRNSVRPAEFGFFWSWKACFIKFHLIILGRNSSQVITVADLKYRLPHTIRKESSFPVVCLTRNCSSRYVKHVLESQNFYQNNNKKIPVASQSQRNGPFFHLAWSELH